MPLAVAIPFGSPSPIAHFAQANHGETIAAIIALGIFCGLVLEDFGARIEDCLFRRRFPDDKEKEARYQDWYDYLRLAYDVEPVGFRYLSTLVLRLKFELGCCSATPFAMLGVWLWPTTYLSRALISRTILALGAYPLNRGTGERQHTGNSSARNAEGIPSRCSRDASLQ